MTDSTGRSETRQRNW